MFAGTFHGFAYRLLQRALQPPAETAPLSSKAASEAAKTILAACGRNGDFTVYDQESSIAAVKAILRAEMGTELRGTELNKEAKSIHNRISKVKNFLPTCYGYTGEDAVSQYYQASIKPAGEQWTPYDTATVNSLGHWYDMYQRSLVEANACDFDDLISLTVGWLQRDEESRATLRRRFRHFLIDEFQDTNGPQYQLLKLLAAPEWEAIDSSGGNNSNQLQQQGNASDTIWPRSVFVVGDPDQAIYGWRGAAVHHMQHSFARDFPGHAVETYDLVDNYRSSSRIVAAAQRVIDTALAPPPPPPPPSAAAASSAVSSSSDITALSSASIATDQYGRRKLRALKGQGPQLQITTKSCDRSEASYIADLIQQTLSKGDIVEEEIAVLVRTHNQAKVIEQELVNRNISYVLIGGVSFWKRAEVIDILSYIRLAASFRDDVALERIINTPKRGIGAASWEKLKNAAASYNVTLSEFLFDCQGSAVDDLGSLPSAESLGVGKKSFGCLETFRALIVQIHSSVATKPLDQAIQDVIQLVAYEKYLEDSNQEEEMAADKKQRLMQLVHVAGNYSTGSLAGGAAEIDWYADSDNDNDNDEKQQEGSNIKDTPPSNALALDTNQSPPSSIPQSSDTERLTNARSFLDEAALYGGVDQGHKTPGVRISTMHAAKGLEFDMVFIPGCVDGLTPLSRGAGKDTSSSSYDLSSTSSTTGTVLAMEASPTSPEEEKRLFYVSMTRARHHLIFTTHGKSMRGGFVDRKPSPYLKMVMAEADDVVIDDQEGTLTGDGSGSGSGNNNNDRYRTKGGDWISGGWKKQQGRQTYSSKSPKWYGNKKKTATSTTTTTNGWGEPSSSMGVAQEKARKRTGRR
jgi:superfamily I DNA/RNA helicase